MADQIRTVASITREGKGPQPHLYDDPDLSPLEFMLAVMRDTTLPLAIRLDAAAKVAPFYHRRLRSLNPHYTIVIPPLSLEPWSEICSPWPRTTAKHSQNSDPSSKTLNHGGDTQAPVNLTTDPEPYSPDYSAPPGPEVFAAARKWGLPEPHLCSYCGHWLTVTYPDCICGRSARDPSKMN